MKNTLFRTFVLASTASLTLWAAGQSFAQTSTFPVLQKPVKKDKPVYQFQNPTLLATKVAMLNGQLDASLVRPDGTALFFVNENYAGYDIPNHKLGFTRAHDLVGVPKDIDAALLHPINRKGYFFKGNTEVVLIDWTVWQLS